MLNYILVLASLCSFITAYPSQSRGTSVQLFEWKWVDIAAECEIVLGRKGYAAVLVSPPQEHVIYNNGTQWWIKYQPVSYNLG
jgi:alpha-amylase